MPGDLYFTKACVCVCAFIFIPWLNSVKYRKCHKMSISQVHLFQKSSCTYKFVYIYIHILKIHIGDWYFHTTSRASIFFGPPTTSPPFVPGCGYPKICICQTETPAKVQTNITGACLDGSTSLSSTTVPQKSAVGSTGSETFQMQMAVG